MAGSKTFDVVKVCSNSICHVSWYDKYYTEYIMLTVHADCNSPTHCGSCALLRPVIRTPTSLQTISSRHLAIFTICAIDIYPTVNDIDIWRLCSRCIATEINT